MAEESTVVSEIEDSIGFVRLNRPQKLNAFTFEMVAAMRAAIDRVASDERAVAIVITGTGRAFSAGLDAGDLKRSASGVMPEKSEAGDANELPALFGYLLRIPKPVIAAINGVAAGGGFVLAMMCDLRFASDDSSFTTAFSKRGLIAEHGTSWLLPRLVGTSSALDLLWSARRIDSGEALRMGFVDRVVPRERLLDEVRAYVGELASSVSPRSLAVIKSQIYRHWSLSMESALDDADRLMKRALRHPDAAEGVASFIERRSPRFQRYKGEKL